MAHGAHDMGYERFSLAIPESGYEKFETKLKIVKEYFGTESGNKAIFLLVTEFERILYESSRYKHILRDAAAHEALYEKEHVKEKR
jgi:hypothetical protein